MDKSKKSKLYLNKTFLSGDGIIHNVYIGDQNVDTVRQTGTELQELISKVKKGGKKVLILTDITRIGKASSSARRAGYDLMRNLDFYKAAIFGNHFLFEKIIEAISIATGCKFKVKLFNTEEEARRWLLIEYV